MKSKSKKVCFFACIGLYVASLILLFIIVSLTATLYRYEEILIVSPNDSRSNTIPSQYFSPLEIYRLDPTDDVSATLYIVDEVPARNVPTSFMLNDVFKIFAKDILSWQFYLPNESNFSVSGCVQEGNSFVLSIIRGDVNYKKWLPHYDPKYTVASTKFSSSETNCSSFDYNISVEDIYYFAYHTNEYTPVTAFIDQMFQRFQFSFDDIHKHSITNCTISKNGFESCQVPVQSSQWIVTTGGVWDATQHKIKVNGIPISSVTGAIAVIAIILGCYFAITTICFAIYGIYSCYRKTTDPLSRNQGKYSTFATDNLMYSL